MAKGSIADLHAALSWDLNDFERGTASIENGFKSLIDRGKQLGNTFRTIGRDMTVALSLPLAGFGAFAFKAASDAAELQDAFDRTFGESAKTMNQWAETTGNALGRSTQTMQENAFRFGIILKQAFSGTEAEEMSKQLSVLAVDLGSLFNLADGEARDKLLSGLAGETEPLRQFGVTINETAVKAKALELGLGGVKKELTEQEKIAIRYALILEQTANAQGNATETAGSTANQMKRAAEAFQELQIVIGTRLIPIITPLIEKIADLIEGFTELPPGVQNAVTMFGVFLFALGPVTSVLTTLAIIILPLFLARLGPVFLGLSLLINPLGTIAVFLTKLVGGFGTVAGGIARVVPLLGRLVLVFARLNPVISAVITVFMLFGDNVSAALGRVWNRVQEVLGPAFERLMTSVGTLITSVQYAFEQLSKSDLGKNLAKLTGLIGNVVGALIEMAGGAVVVAIEFIINLITTIVQVVSDVVSIVTLLFQGDWSAAWEMAKQTVANMIDNMWPSFQNLYNWIVDALAMLGILEERQRAAAFVGAEGAAEAGVANLKGASSRLVRKPAARSGGGDKKKGSGRRGSGRSGPTAEELAARRAELDFEHQLALARESGDVDRIRALERQRDIKAKIEQYEKAGLSNAAARARVEEQMLDIDAARAAGRDKALSDDRIELQLQEARIRGDHEAVRLYEEELWLRDRIAELRERGYDAAVAEKIASEDLLNLELARSKAIADRVRDQELSRQIELARLRGDSEEAINALEERQRMADRIGELEGEFGLSRTEAEDQAMREASDRSRAYIQGNFREAFRDGLKAAMDGNLKEFFQRWLEDASFNALAKVLDKLADRLADLIAGDGSGGGLLDAIGSALGLVAGGSRPGVPVDGVIVRHAGSGGGNNRPPGFARGGGGRLGGLAGVDRNMLSLNGTPIARVSRDELLEVRPANDVGRGGYLEVRMRKDGELEAYMHGIAGKVVNERAPMIGAATQQATITKLQQMQDDRLE